MKTKRYCVSAWTKKRFYRFSTNSIKVSKLIFKLGIWNVAKITDRIDYTELAYIKRRETNSKGLIV